MKILVFEPIPSKHSKMIGDEVIWPVLVPLLEDEDHRVRGNVAKTLYGFDGDEAHKTRCSAR